MSIFEDGQDPVATIKGMFAVNEGDEAIIDEAFTFARREAAETALRAVIEERDRLREALGRIEDIVKPDVKMNGLVWNDMGGAPRNERIWRLCQEGFGESSE